MTLEGGAPLLVERKVGRGRVLMLTGTLDLGWGNLPLQAVYMPLIQRLVGYLGGETGGGGERLSGVVGDPVLVPLPDTSIEIDIIGPSGPVAASVSGNGVSFTPERIGAYSVQTPGAPPLAWVAVNVDPAESDVRPGPSLIETAAEVDPERFLHRKGLSPWVLLAVLGFAALQALLATRRRSAKETADAE